MAEAKQAAKKAPPTTKAVAKRTDQEMQDVARAKQEIPLPAEFKALEIVRQRIREIREFIARGLLEKGIDYGLIPGVKKNMLFKAGCEMLLLNYQIVVDPPEIDDKSDFDKGIFRYRILLRGYDKGTRTYIGMGIASCSSYETKYRYRWLGSGKLTDTMRAMGYNKETGRFDPEILKQAWIAQHGETSFRFQTGQNGSYPQWRVENLDTWDLENTILKQCTTRALRALTLNVTGADRLFANEKDLEDLGLSELDDVDFVEGEYKIVEPETGEILTPGKTAPAAAPARSQAPKATTPTPARAQTGGEPAPAPGKLPTPTTDKPINSPCPKHPGGEFRLYPTKGGGTVMAHRDGFEPDGITKKWCFEADVKTAPYPAPAPTPAPAAPVQAPLTGPEPNDMDAVDVKDNNEFLQVINELCVKVGYDESALKTFLENNYPTSGTDLATFPLAVRKPLLKDLYALAKSGVLDE